MSNIHQKDLDQYKNSDALAIRKRFYQNATGKDITDVLFEVIDIDEGMSVLDIGCGAGGDLIKLAGRYNLDHVVGIDPSGQLIEEAKTAKGNLAINFHVADLEHYDTAKKFDRILIRHALHLIQDPKKAVKQTVGLLKSDGKAIFVLHSDETLPKMQKWIDEFSRESGFEYSRTMRGITLERDNGIFHLEHVTTERTPHKIIIKLTDPKPYLDYFETIRHRWTPEPDDQEWGQLMQRVRGDIEREIKRSGVFTETSVNGVVILAKQP